MLDSSMNMNIDFNCSCSGRKTSVLIDAINLKEWASLRKKNNWIESMAITASFLVTVLHPGAAVACSGWGGGAPQLGPDNDLAKAPLSPKYFH